METLVFMIDKKEYNSSKADYVQITTNKFEDALWLLLWSVVVVDVVLLFLLLFVIVTTPTTTQHTPALQTTPHHPTPPAHSTTETQRSLRMIFIDHNLI